MYVIYISMLPFVTIGEQMSVVLDMTSHGLFRVQMLVTTFLLSHLASFLVDFGRHVMQHIFFPLLFARLFNIQYAG
jgi:hypothetical protein